MRAATVRTADSSSTNKMVSLPCGLNVGQQAPEINGVDFQGQGLKLSDYRGKVVVLVFWQVA